MEGQSTEWRRHLPGCEHQSHWNSTSPLGHLCRYSHPNSSKRNSPRRMPVSRKLLKLIGMIRVQMPTKASFSWLKSQRSAHLHLTSCRLGVSTVSRNISNPCPVLLLGGSQGENFQSQETSVSQLTMLCEELCCSNVDSAKQRSRLATSYKKWLLSASSIWHLYNPDKNIQKYPNKRAPFKLERFQWWHHCSTSDLDFAFSIFFNPAIRLAAAVIFSFSICHGATKPDSCGNLFMRTQALAE